MLRLLPLSLLLTLCVAATAQAANVKVPVPPEGQITVATAKVASKAKVKAKAPAGIAVTGSAKKGRLGVAVMHRRGVIAGGSVTLKVKGKVRGLKVGTAPACKGLAALLAKPLQSAGIGAADLKALGAAAAAKVCGKPFEQALLDRLGLGTPPATGGGIAKPGGAGGRTNPQPGGGGAPANQCWNGIDDDGDGQVDAPSERKLRPDPGCMNENDPSETGEVPLSCDAGAGVGDDRSVLEVGINDGCGEFVEVAVYASPNAFVCDIGASAGNWVCLIAHGHAFAETRNATDAEMADLTIGLDGDVDCTVPATIVLTRRNLEVAELVTPIARCGGQAAPECSNGKDDDNDGVADARSFGTDPDPGCSSTDDTTEDSEIGLPAGCEVGGGNAGGDPRFPAITVTNCGSVTGVWFKPPGSPTDCLYAIGAGVQACQVTGATVGATFPATTAEIELGTHTTTDASCAPVTVAITLADGNVAKLRDDWC
jgi:hypothetical protein